MSAPAVIYACEVMHRRYRPIGYLFRYRIFSLLIDSATRSTSNTAATAPNTGGGTRDSRGRRFVSGGVAVGVTPAATHSACAKSPALAKRRLGDLSIACATACSTSSDIGGYMLRSGGGVSFT